MSTPIILEGDNLGQRHRHLNQLVNDAYNKKVSFEYVRELKEYSEVDRLYKIDLANKYKYVEYILQNFRSDNMLYVSRALQSTWIITDAAYDDKMNPTYLNDKLFPTMHEPAVNMLAHTIERLLKDETRCQIFYQYYSYKKSDTAFKYLPKCSENFIMQEIKKKDINPSKHLLKMLCEKNPLVAEYYFKYMAYEGPSAETYYKDQEKFLNSIKFLLKTNPDIYLDILERLHLQWFTRLSEEATHFVMKTQFHRFEAKPELYATWILNLKTVAQHLNEEQLKKIIVKLARADYLRGWFTYKNAEPLLKRLNKEGKSAFVKSIFVEKSFGPGVKESPYEFPKAPERKPNSVPEFRSMLRKRKYCASMPLHSQPMQLQSMPCLRAPNALLKRKIIKKRCGRVRTLMDDLYDMYRFANFSKTFFELRKRIQGEPNHSNRQTMLTVLITKSKTNESNVKLLLEYFLQKHLNEPITVKCSFARTIVNQAKAYKFSKETWNLLETIFENIGVFGVCDEDISPCIEAIIIYSVLNQLQVPVIVIEKYFKSFSTLSEYSLSTFEKTAVFNFLFSLIHDKIEMSLNQSKTSESLNYTWHMISLIDQWNKILFEYTTVLNLIKRIVAADPTASESLLHNIYLKLKGHRKIFFPELFNLRHSEQSYINALKHDKKLLLDNLENFGNVIESEFHHERFLRKVGIYFQRDLSNAYIEYLDKKDSPKKFKVANNIARALCVLNCSKVHDIIQSSSRIQCQTALIWFDFRAILDYFWSLYRSFTSAIFSMVGLGQPTLSKPVDVDEVSVGKIEDSLPSLNVKKINFNEIILKHLFLINPPIGVNKLIGLRQAATIPLTTISYRHPSDMCRIYIQDLISGPQPFVKLAVRLAFKKLRDDETIEICRTVWAKTKSKRVKIVLLEQTHKRICKGDDFTPQLWEFLKLVIENLELTQKESIYTMLSSIKNIPDFIKPNYCQTVYNFFTSLKKKTENKALEFSREWRTEIVNFINNEIFKFESDFLYDILHGFLNEMRVAKEISEDFIYDEYNTYILSLIPNYLLSCDTTDDQLMRYDATAKQLMEIIKSLKLKDTKAYMLKFLMDLNYHMDTKKTDATPVIMKFTEEIESLLPFEENFDVYICIRMSLVHADAIKITNEEIKASAEYNPKRVELIDKIGYHLGKRIGLEVERICSEYNVTAKELTDIYATKHFSTQFLDYAWRQEPKLAIAEGLISNTDTTNGLLFGIEYLASNFHRIECKNVAKFSNLINKIKDLKKREVKMLIYAKLTQHLITVDLPQLN